jgi:hypothetical protein
MVFMSHKFLLYLLGNKFVFNVDHMALMHLINMPQVFGKIAKWLLLFLKYNFMVVYKLGKNHAVANVLSRLLGHTCTIVCDTTYMVTWDVTYYLKTSQFLNNLSMVHK